MSKLGIIVSHPIQYYSPLFRHLASHIDVEVFYGYQPTSEQLGNVGFGHSVEWGIDLLSGYRHRFLNNVSSETTTEHFTGLDVPDVGKVLAEAKVTHLLILGWNLKFYWQAYLYALKNHIPVSVRGDSQINFSTARWKRIIRRMLYPLFLRRYSRIFYVGKCNRDYLLANGATDNQLLFAPHAVDQIFWHRLAEKRDHRPTIRFLWVAKFIELKRPFDAISAFRQALIDDSDIELCMVGSGPLLNACRREAKDESRIHFQGFRNQIELKEDYTAADCLLLTSDSETWGLVVNEAMSMGLPAIVSEVCGCADDLIVDGVTGFRFPLRDVEALKDKMLTVASMLREDPHAFTEGLAKTNQTYSFARNLSSIEQFLSI